MEKVIDVKEFKLISRQFRRIGGDLLHKEDTDEAIRMAKRFINYVESEPIIADFIRKNNVIEFNIKEIIETREFNEKFHIPLDDKEEIAFIYQLLKYMTENFERYDLVSRPYAWYRGAKVSDSIREFNREVVKLLVNRITDYLEEKAIELGIDERPNAKVLIQGNLGQLNFSETGNVQANQQNNSQDTNEALLTLTKDLIAALKETNIENTTDKEDAIDFVEEAVNSLEAGNQPKQSVIRRLKGSLSKIRPIVEDTSYIAMQIDKVFHAFN